MITDEMIEKSKKLNNLKGFCVIDDDYILIKDTFDDSWIEKTKRLRAQGVNYCGPVECRKIEDKTYALEHRAHGMEMDITRSLNGKEDYLKAFGEYMRKLETLYNAPQEQYDKFFDDIDKMAEEEIIPDVCNYGNLFYDPEIGFTFIDVYPNARRERISVDSIFNILLNFKFSVDGITLLPEEYRSDYNLMMKELYRKISSGLLKFGYPESDIKAYVERAVHSFPESDCARQGEVQKIFCQRAEEKRKQNIISIEF